MCNSNAARQSREACSASDCGLETMVGLQLPPRFECPCVTALCSSQTRSSSGATRWAVSARRWWQPPTTSWTAQRGWAAAPMRGREHGAPPPHGWGRT